MALFDNFKNNISSGLVGFAGYDPNAPMTEQERQQRQNQGLQDLAQRLSIRAAQRSGDPSRMGQVQQRLITQQAVKDKRIQDEKFKQFLQSPQGQQYQGMVDLFGIDGTRDVVAKNMAGKSGRTSTADIDNFEYYMSLPPEGKKAWRENKRLSPELMGLIAQEQAAGKDGGVSLTPIEKKIDENFGKEATEYLSGGKAQIEANIINLDDKIRILEKGELNVSGPVVGNLPEGAQSIFNAPALSFIGDIRDIVFQSLREKLGAQFTEREGDRLVAAAFDQRLPEAANIKRLKRLQGVIKNAAKSKEDMIAYANKNNTLKGYVADPLTFNNIYDSLVSEDFAGKTDEELKSLFNSGNEDTKNAIIRFLEKREK